MLLSQDLARQPCSNAFSGITLGRSRAEVQADGLRVVETWHPALLRLPRHDHEDASINLVISGSIQEQVGERGFDCGAGMVLAKPGGASHANRYGSIAVRSVVIQLPRDGGFAETWRSALDDVRLLRSSLGSVILARLIAAREDQTDDSRLALLEGVADLLAIIAKAPPTVNHGVTPAWLVRVRHQLDDSDSHDILLSRIAMEAGVDAVTLCRGFSAAFGCPPSAYLRQRRVGRAATAIATGDGSLSSIAWQSGFSDQAHLTHVFRRLTGMTPGQYRAVISGNSQSR